MDTRTAGAILRTAILGFACAWFGGVRAAGVVDGIQSMVKENWSELSEKCLDIMELEREIPNLPDHTWMPFTTDKDDQRKKIRKIQMAIREILLSEGAQKILEKTDRLSEKIAARKEDVAKLGEELQFYPENREKIERKIADARAEIKSLTASRDQELEKVRAELDSIGLHMKGENGGTLFSLVNRGDLIDNVVVAKGVYEIVTRLQNVMRGGDVLSAKRYFGVYVALTDVQILCYEQYLEKSQKGEWRTSLERIDKEAQAAIDSANACIAGGEYTPAQCEIFRKNIAMNNKMVGGVAAYRKLLDSHEKIISRKLADVGRMRKLAYNSFATVSGAANFAALLQSSQAEFAAVLELSLPELEGVDDAALQEQLQLITNMLDR